MSGAVEPGVPGWVDLGSPDLEASKAFYREVFGWRAEASPDPEYGGYSVFTQDGKAVAGVGPLMMQGQPTVWSTYVIVDDAEATAAKVAPAGGSVMVTPMAVGDQGHMAVFIDPTGAAIGVWQPGKMHGADLFNEPGSVSWNELATRDTAAASGFYSAVFGWDPDEAPYGESTYTQWRLDGKAIAGMMPMGDMFPPEVPAHWGVYFAVENCDDAVVAVSRAGGTVTMPPMDIPQGRFAGVVDPQGAPFYVIALAD
jgi:uncharacterized protein